MQDYLSSRALKAERAREQMYLAYNLWARPNACEDKIQGITYTNETKDFI